jgi:hypothetical protein
MGATSPYLDVAIGRARYSASHRHMACTALPHERGHGIRKCGPVTLRFHRRECNCIKSQQWTMRAISRPIALSPSVCAPRSVDGAAHRSNRGGQGSRGRGRGGADDVRSAAAGRYDRTSAGG